MAGGDFSEQVTPRPFVTNSGKLNFSNSSASLSSGYYGMSSCDTLRHDYYQDSDRSNPNSTVKRINSDTDVKSHEKSAYMNSISDFRLDLTDRSQNARSDLERNYLNSISRSEVRYINSAIFIEKLEPENDNYMGDCYLDENETDLQYDFPNLNIGSGDIQQTAVGRKSCSLKDFEKNNSDEGSASTIIVVNDAETSMTLPFSSMHSSNSSVNLRKSSICSYEDWLALKEKQRMLKEMRQNVENEIEQAERQKRLEKQREDFKRWLEIKKAQEEKIKQLEMKRRLKKEKEHEQVRKKKVIENEKAFKGWLKKKSAELEEKKKKVQLEVQMKEEEKRLRRERSTHAFDEWVEKSKCNPLPVPLNMGVQSLRGSVSSMFVNPNPWQENIEKRCSST